MPDALADPIPMSPDEISADWLARALNADVRGVEVLEQHAGTTGRARLRVALADGAEHLFAKLPPTDPNQRLMVQATGMGRNEARFYAEVAAEVPVRVPRPMLGVWNQEGSAYLILLEDLTGTGCRFPDLAAGASLAYAGRTVEALARLHAHFWNDPRFGEELAWIAPPARHEIGPTLVQQALDRFADEMPPAFAEMGRIYAEDTDGVHDAWEEGETTLLHGDAHLGNLFEENGGVGFLDWGCIARGPGIRDVSHFLASSLAPEVRRAEERGLVARYRAVLLEAGAPAPAFDEIWRRHRLHVAYTWVAASATLAMGDAWQPLAYARKAVERATAAVTELESAALLREVLGR